MADTITVNKSTKELVKEMKTFFNFSSMDKTVFNVFKNIDKGKSTDEDKIVISKIGSSGSTKAYQDFIKYIEENIQDKYPAIAYLYIMYSKMYPNLIKIGYSSAPEKRIVAINKSDPSHSYRFLYISKPMFLQVTKTETTEKILKDTLGLSEFNKEWFNIDKLDLATKTIKNLEKLYSVEQEQ